MEEYFRSLIQRCNNGQLSANDMLKRVEHSDFVSPTAALKKAKKALPPKQKKKPSILVVQEDLPSSMTSLSTKATEQELPRTMNTCSLTTLEDTNSVAPEKSVYEKQADLRQNLVMQSAEGLNLQKFIEVQLSKITEKLGPIQDKEQLEDIKRKCRLKWMLRMKQIQRERVRKEEEEYKANCSFQPKINDSDVNSRYMDPPPSFRSLERSISPEFSFTPRINKKSISILRSSAKYNKAGNRESSVESNRGSVQNQSVHFKSVQSEGPLLTNRFKSNTRASIVSGNQAIDEDFNDLMQNLNSVRPCPKEQSPKMFIEDMRQPQQEENRVEKVLDFNDDNYSVQNSNKKQSLGLYRNYLTQMTETTSRNLTIPSARSPQNKQQPKVMGRETATKPKTMIRSESLNKSVCKDNSRLRGSVNNKENYNGCKKNHGVTESANKAVSKEARNKWFEEFFNRTQQHREEKSKRLDQVTQDVIKDVSFQPKISKFTNNTNATLNSSSASTSTALSKWSYEEKVNKFLKDKEEWLAKKREEKAVKELEGVTHQPTINKKVAASSKLNRDLPTGLYIEKLKEQEQVEKEYADLMKRRQLMLETAECTHRPQINENPFQLRKILSPQSSKTLASSLSSSVNNGGSSSYKTLHSKKIQNVTVGLSQRANTRLFYNNHKKENQTTVPSLFEGIHNLTTDNDYYSYYS